MSHADGKQADQSRANALEPGFGSNWLHTQHIDLWCLSDFPRFDHYDWLRLIRASWKRDTPHYFNKTLLIFQWSQWWEQSCRTVIKRRCSQPNRRSHRVTISARRSVVAQIRSSRHACWRSMMPWYGFCCYQPHMPRKRQADLILLIQLWSPLNQQKPSDAQQLAWKHSDALFCDNGLLWSCVGREFLQLEWIDFAWQKTISRQSAQLTPIRHRTAWNAWIER